MSTSTPEESILYAALQLQDANARSEYISRACGSDAQLKKRVDRLASAYLEGEFLESPIADLAATALLPPVGEKPGDTIGPYKLLEQIGEGGMGLVFMAEQAKPLRRRVALKIIKPGLDTRAVIARFEAERQALALMDHPNIARVFDAGATESGRPFFVMELMRGLPITEYCRERHVPLRERLDLFIEVCDAIQHAHQKGIIHRDLKPTNILVAQSDTKAVPKVIDFGVAKATAQPLTDRTLFTAFSQIIGTPLYMSPEQADLGNQDVDTRSDVYSLGVVLYELLTGTTPFDAQWLRSAGVDEMRRIIREEEPPKPSTRATTQAAALSTVAANAAVRHLPDMSALKGDLDCIVMKAIEKDRRRRFESPSALAADIVRHINNEPIEAFPPSRRYQLQKFVRRNRGVLLTTGAIATALLLGLGASIWQAVQATNAEQAKGIALQQARRAVDDMYTKVAEQWLEERGNLTDVQRELLESAAAFYDSLTKQRGTGPEVLYENIRALDRVGRIRRRLGDTSEAGNVYRRLIDECSRLAQQFREHPEFRSELVYATTQLAVVYRNLDRPKDAASALEQALTELKSLSPVSLRAPEHRQRFAAALGNLSSELTVAGRTEEADKTIRMALDIRQQLVAERPNEFEYRRGLAVGWTTLGQRQMWWGSADGKAEATLRRAESLLTELLKLRPNDVTTRRALVQSLINLGVVLSWQKRNDEAVEVDRRALSIVERLAKEFPNDLNIQDSLSTALRNLAASLASRGQGLDEELKTLKLRAHDILERMATDFPDELDPKLQYLTSLIEISRMLYSLEEHDSSQQLLERASPLLRDFAANHAENPSITSRIGVSLTKLAAGHIEQGDYQRAVDAIKSYPTDTTKFNSDLRLPFQIAPDKIPERRRDYFEAQVYLLLTPAFMLEQCASLAESDQALKSRQRTATVREYAERSQFFRDQAELAIDAWLKEVYARDDDIAFRVALEAQQRVDGRETAQTNTTIPPALRAAYKAADDEMFRRLVDEANEHLADNVEQIHLANVLSAAPQELRDPDLAFTLAQQGLKVAPEDPAARQALGWALFRAGKWQECVDILLSSKEAEADQPRAILAMALWQLGRRNDAREKFQDAQKRLEAYQLARDADKAKGLATLPTTSMMRRLNEEAKVLLQALQTESDSNSKR